MKIFKSLLVLILIVFLASFVLAVEHYVINESSSIFNSEYKNCSQTGLYGGVFNVKENGSLSLNKVCFSTNTTRNGGAIYNEGEILVSSNSFSFNSSQKGGAIFNYLGTTNIDSTIFDSNTTLNFFEDNIGGGAVYNYGGTMTISSTSFNSNISTYNGGAIFNYYGGIITISSSVFNSNMSKEQHGGAIYNSVGDIVVSSSIFNSNMSTYKGGAIYNSEGNVIISSSIFDSNVSKYDNDGYMFSGVGGGAIFNAKTTIIHATSFTYNTSNSKGGAIYNSMFSKLTISSSVFNSNIAKYYGGAIFNEYASDNISISSTTFSSNIANYGGAIYNFGGMVTVSSSLFKKNIANVYGGAIYNGSFYEGEENPIIYEAILNLIADTGDIVFTENSANGISNAIYDSSGTINLYASETSKIIFNDRITSAGNSSVLNINKSTNTINAVGIVELNEDMSGYTGTINLYAGKIVLSQGNKFFNTEKFTIHGGTLTANASDILNKFLNNGTVIFNGGNNSNEIDGTGNTIIDGSVINSSVIKNNITINENKDLTTNASDIVGNITNNGSLIFNGGINNNEIIGVGNLQILEDTINNSTVNQSSITVLSLGKLTNNSTIETIGYINNGNTVNNSTISVSKEYYNVGITTNTNYIKADTYTNKKNSITDNIGYIKVDNLNIEEGSIFNSALDHIIITKKIESNGKMEIKEGKIENNMVGTGELIIDNIVENNSDIQQSSMTINTNANFTNNENITIKDILINNGKLTNEGEMIVDSLNNISSDSTITNNSTIQINDSGINSGIIEGTGILTINNDFDNLGNLSQNKINITSGTFNNESNMVADDVLIDDIAKLETNASDVTGTITNNGNLMFNGGTNNNEINGTGTLTISDDFTNNNNITQNSICLKNAILQQTKNSNLEYEKLIVQNSTIDLANSILQEYNLKNLTVKDNLNLFVDADLENKQMDTISAESFGGSGKINVKAINILSDAIEEQTEVLFTSSTILKNKITTIKTANSDLYKYDIKYKNGYFTFNKGFKPIVNSIILESQVASAVGGIITQTTVINQALAGIDNIRDKMIQAKKKGLLYASTSDLLFEQPNRIESGLWIRPYAMQDSLNLNNVAIDNTAIGTLAGLDLSVGENSLLAFYIGYAGSNQKYEEVKVNQTGYVVGVTGMIIKEDYYVGLTANINFNKASAESDYGTDDFDMNMYSVGAKAGYNIDLGKKWILEPNLTLMYGNINSQDYQTKQGAKIDSQSTNNMVVEPQVKAKLDLTDGWTPYALVGYMFNIGEKTKLVANNISFEDMQISRYIEYGLGVSKNFKNSAWSCFLQVTGKGIDRKGIEGNLGIKYSFLSSDKKQVKKETIIEQQKNEELIKEQERKLELENKLKGELDRIKLEEEKKKNEELLEKQQKQVSDTKIINIEESNKLKKKKIKDIKMKEKPTFYSSKSTLTPQGKKTLKEVAEKLKNYKNEMLLIEGHTDSTGNKQKNLQLSKQRALSVANTLKKEYKVKNEIVVVGKGGTVPIASNTTTEGKAKNRRVEFIIISK